MHRVDGGHQDCRAAVTSSALVTCLWWSLVTEPGQDCPNRPISPQSVCMNTDIYAFLHIRGSFSKEEQTRERISVQATFKIPTSMTDFFFCKTKASFTGVLTSHSKTSEHQFHTLAHLASYPSSVAFRISPATRLNSGAKGHGGPALPLSSLLPL